MKKLLILLLTVAVFGIQAKGQNLRSVNGTVVDDDTGKGLPYVTVKVEGTNMATVTNSDGGFSLKIPLGSEDAEVGFYYLGYQPTTVGTAELLGGKKNVVRLKQASLNLSEAVARTGEASLFMKEVFKRVAVNYSAAPIQMVGFYREYIKRNSTYTSITEAVIDVYKAPYANYAMDQAKIYKARRSTNWNKRDTLLVRYQGGVEAVLTVDLAKNYTDIFSDDFHFQYDFKFEEPTAINNRICEVISFSQKKNITTALFKGKFYIDAQSLAIAKVEFSVNIDEDKDEKASSNFLKKIPPGVKGKVTEATYLVQFVEQNGTWYYQYAKARVEFQFRWPRRLFRSSYTVQSEMAITDWDDEGAAKFSRKERLKPNDIIAERAVDFEDENFWGDYNIIEPEESIEKAINQLARKLKRRER